LAGLLTWYKGKNPDWRADAVGSTVGLGLAYVLWMSIDMHVTIKKPGGWEKTTWPCRRKRLKGDKLRDGRG
jgi:hypothetical protein